ncbi:sensor histidine kinase [Streptomyces yaizuensis]|uniref:histidine kinase n=1 Tax=Streptomyces yaizuensis TaxID=2989713 RepID=A0ABQ5P253_9ACTN|nr:histidine kinase [Streptomyces sp. YSPA8]GLF96677.1 two-component sensor histidine kinase [Streptomyces sp. YSPA8]
MNLSSSKILAGLRAGWTWLAVAEPWSLRGEQQRPAPGRRMGAELTLALVMALLAVLIEWAFDAGPARTAGSGVGAGLVTLLRRRLPVPALIVACLLGTVLPGMALVQMLAGWSAGRRVVGTRRAVVAFSLAYLAGMAALAVHPGAGVPLTPSNAVILTLVYLAMVVMPGLVSRYWTQRKTLLHALQERNAQLLWERRMIAGQARLMERQRIAQDMHDSLGHQLALIAVHTGALEVDPELTGRQREAVGVLRTASVSAMHELREVVGILRDGVEAARPGPADETGRAARGTAGVAELVETARAAGNTVELRTEGEPRPLAAAADHAAYRIVQEALTNAYKHAPGAPIGVALRYEPDSLVVEILSGPPRTPAGDVVSGGQGLTGLRERARLVGGMVHAGAVDGGGFRVAGVLPYGAGESTPLAAAVDDVRWQPPAGLPGDGGPAMDWNAAGRDIMMGELDASMRRGRNSGLGLGCGVAIGALFLVVMAVGAVLWLVVDEFDAGMIDTEEYDRIKVGTAEREVRDRLPEGGTFTTEGLDRKGPPKPDGSECLVLMSSEMTDTLTTEPVFRFCFRDGKLIEKKAYHTER